MFQSCLEDSRTLELIELRNAIRTPDTRPVRRFHPSWLYCRVHNNTEQPLFVYGPRHPSDQTTIPTSLFLLPAGSSTPKRWDCKGILIPSDRTVIQGSSIIHGPVVLKYRDMRRISVTETEGRYQCLPCDGVVEPGQMDFMVPMEGCEELLGLPRRQVPV